MIKNEDFELAKAAFSRGAYSTAFDVCVSLVRGGVTDGHVQFYRTMSEAGSKNVDQIAINEFEAGLAIAFDRIMGAEEELSDLLSALTEELKACNSLRASLEDKYQKTESELQAQRRDAEAAAAGDDTEKQRRVKELTERGAKLQSQYQDIVHTMFGVPVKAIAQSARLHDHAAEVPLEFLTVLSTVRPHLDEGAAAFLDRFTSQVKEKRNAKYWSEHAELYEQLCGEKETLQAKIREVIAAEKGKVNEVITKTEQAISEAKGQRSQFSLFKLKERRPFNQIISENKQTLKAARKTLAELDAGTCAACAAEISRVAKINEELTVQR